MRFSKMYFPRRACEKNSPNCKIPECSDPIDFRMVLPIFITNSMQKTPPMHLNKSPTSFEGSGTGKHETKTQNLRTLKTCPENPKN